MPMEDEWQQPFCLEKRSQSHSHPVRYTTISVYRPLELECEENSSFDDGSQA